MIESIKYLVNFISMVFKIVKKDDMINYDVFIF